MNIPEKIVFILMERQHSSTYAQLDTNFLKELEALNIDPVDENRAFVMWLGITDHVIENRRTLTFDERQFMISIFDRIINRNQTKDILAKLKKTRYSINTSDSPTD